MEPRIFVNIASYRDTECQWTIRDLFAKAAKPDRIFVGLCWQFVPDDDADCFQVETRPDQVRRIDFHAKESRGVCWARNQAQALWRDEEFTLQIDSHMRFVEGWDEILLEMYVACPTDRAVLSSYPVAYTPPDDLVPPGVTTMSAKWFDAVGMLRFNSIARSPADAPAEPAPSAFVAAGFLFAPAAVIEEVSYDPHIYFQGEEITLAVRLWTHGWDLFSPNKHVLYHDYTKRPARARHWSDDVDWPTLNRRSEQRVRHLLGMDVDAEPGALEALERYGLGDDRTLEDYQSFSGIRFKEMLINGRSILEPAPAETDEAGTAREKVFQEIWSTSSWGSSESVSGDGATMARTEVIRVRLPLVFEDLGIEILGDAGCGDLNWMASVSHSLRLYLGFDIVPGLIDDLRVRFADRPTHFFTPSDIVRQAPPRCDAILCRDCLTHLTHEEARLALRGFKKSGSTYLIATTHEGRENRQVETGGWYAMNLQADPFAFGPPMMAIDEELPGATKTLGVWRLDDLET